MNLHWNTVSPALESTLQNLMCATAFRDFRFVGGTALSLYLGHRMSADIDLFTDAEYGSVNFEEIDDYLRATFPYITTSDSIHGMGKSYFIGASQESAIKLDLYYTDPFIRPTLVVGDGIRLAGVDDIIAMKVEVVANGGRKKDFWDLHALLESTQYREMIELHQERYPYGHDEAEIRKRFADFSIADDDFEPICLQGKHWEFIKFDILKALEI